jgi:hypothetical protein
METAYLPEIVEYALTAVVPSFTKALAILVGQYLSTVHLFRGEIIHRLPLVAQSHHSEIRLVGTALLKCPRGHWASTTPPTSFMRYSTTAAPGLDLTGCALRSDLLCSRDGKHGWCKSGRAPSITVALRFDPPLNGNGTFPVRATEIASIPDVPGYLVADLIHGVPSLVQSAGGGNTYWRKLDPLSMATRETVSVPFRASPWLAVVAGTLFTISYAGELTTRTREVVAIRDEHQMYVLSFKAKQVDALKFKEADALKFKELDCVRELAVQIMDSKTARITIWFSTRKDCLMQFDVDTITGLPRDAVVRPRVADPFVANYPGIERIQTLEVADWSCAPVPDSLGKLVDPAGYPPQIYGQSPLVFANDQEIVFAV